MGRVKARVIEKTWGVDDTSFRTRPASCAIDHIAGGRHDFADVLHIASRSRSTVQLRTTICRSPG